MKSRGKGKQNSMNTTIRGMLSAWRWKCLICDFNSVTLPRIKKCYSPQSMGLKCRNWPFVFLWWNENGAPFLLLVVFTCYNTVTREIHVKDVHFWTLFTWRSGNLIPWVPEDIFLLSILMVRGEATSTRQMMRREGILGIRYFDNGPLEPG